MRSAVGIAVIVSMVLAGASAPVEARPPGERWRVQWLGAENVKLLRAADRVEAFAVRPWPVGRPDQGAESLPPPVLPPGTPTEIGGYPVYAVGPTLGADFVRELVSVVLDESSYAHGFIKGCILRPGVAFRVRSRNAVLDVILCFHCDQALIGPLRGRKADDRVAVGEIDPGRAVFLRLAKKALPAVAEIQAVPEVRPEHGDRYRPFRGP